MGWPDGREDREARAFQLAELLSELAQPERLLVLEAARECGPSLATIDGVARRTGISRAEVEELFFDLGCLALFEKVGGGVYQLTGLGRQCAADLGSIRATLAARLDAQVGGE